MCLQKDSQLFSSSAFFTVSCMCSTLGLYLHKAEPHTSSSDIKSPVKYGGFLGALSSAREGAREVVPLACGLKGEQQPGFPAFHGAPGAALPLSPSPHLPLPCAAALVRKQMGACRFGGTKPHQEQPLHFPGGEVMPRDLTWGWKRISQSLVRELLCSSHLHSATPSNTDEVCTKAVKLLNCPASDLACPCGVKHCKTQGGKNCNETSLPGHLRTQNLVFWHSNLSHL